jgi:hypothetical protein
VVGACAWTSRYHRDEVTIRIKTRNTVGDTVIPGTETMHATATATAVIEFRCSWKPAEKTGPQKDKDKSEKAAVPGPLTFDCDGHNRFDVDPLHPAPWAELSKTLFAVHLIND